MTAALFGPVSPSTTQQTPSRKQPFVRIPGTQRAIGILDSGTRLERRPVYLSREAWQAVWRLCSESRRSTSLMLEALVIEADKQAPQAKGDTHVQ